MQFKGFHVKSKIVDRDNSEGDNLHNSWRIFSKFIISLVQRGFRVDFSVQKRKKLSTSRGIGLESYSQFNGFTWRVFRMGSMSTDAEFGAEFGHGQGGKRLNLDHHHFCWKVDGRPRIFKTESQETK